MKTIPYLNFDGNCREAFTWYAEILDGEIHAMMSFEDSPICDEVSEDWHGRVMHAYLTADEVVLMGGDIPPGVAHRPGGIHVSLHVDSLEDAERIWTALEQGGTPSMPLGQTFWAERFGMLVDRFGTPWMINYEGSVSYRPTEPAASGGEG
jgi:PhnB protein